MLRRGPWWSVTRCASVIASTEAATVLSSSSSSSMTTPLTASKRGLKTLDVREYKPLGIPMELRFYQRFTNHPNHQSGVQFLTHYNTYRRFDVHGKDYIDYMNWGKEQGQARLPHRHQRVAFDFNDSLQPTRGNFRQELFRSQDPSMESHPNLEASFNPRKKVFSMPEHWNKLFSRRRPGEGDIKIDKFGTQSLLEDLTSYTDTKTDNASAYFKRETRPPNHGLVPGINQEFLGEEDRHMMQAMSQPLNRSQTITTNMGRFSKVLYLNNSKKHQKVGMRLARELSKEIDVATNALYTKLAVLQAAQSGQTEWFCQGLDLDEAGHNMSMAILCQNKAAALLDVQSASSSSPSSSIKKSREAQQLLDDAARYELRCDQQLRHHAALLWRIFTSPKPLMTIINGKCRGTGCGVALLSKYAVSRDSSEFIFDGPNAGLTPFGGLTHFLARQETSLKFPGLAEFIMLTGASLFAGDVLKLGWTDLFSSVSDMDYHIKEWFDGTEHLHQDAIAWQLGHLLQATCKMTGDKHSGLMERCAITPTRARWIEDAFADQSSLSSILATLTEMETMPLSNPHNTRDAATVVPFSLPSVEAAVEKLRSNRMQFSLEPWDITELKSSSNEAGSSNSSTAQQTAADVFTSYVLERRSAPDGTKRDVVVHQDRQKLRRWREQRYAEFKAHEAVLAAPQSRHVFVRIEGCEGKLVDFEFTFDRKWFIDERKAQVVLSAAKSAAAVRTADSSLSSSSALDDAALFSMTDALKKHICRVAGMPEGRELELGWYLPTLDTCPIFTDDELQTALRHDPGIEDPQSPTNQPPIYLIVKRKQMYLSEWAYAVKHQLLLSSPFALKASLQLLKDVRGDGGEDSVASLSATLGMEFRFVRKLMHRSDFVAVGQHIDKSPQFWRKEREDKEQHIHLTSNPLRPYHTFDKIFETNVEISGHRFLVRPQWSPRTIEDVDDGSIAALSAPLDFAVDRTTELDVPTFCSKMNFIVGMVDDAGVEVTPGLGEKDTISGKPKVEPLVSNASVPSNVDFYEMARHPWNDTQTSWRQDGFTAGSQEYFNRQYRKAQQALHDANNRGQHDYWPTKSAVEATTAEEEETLLKDRFFNAFKEGEQQVDSWARDLRNQALSGQLSKRLEIATQQEKVFDDEYYRWFIQPGVHPNPSGLIYGKKAASAVDAQADAEMQSALHSFGMVDATIAQDGSGLAATMAGYEYGMADMQPVEAEEGDEAAVVAAADAVDES